MKQFRKLYSAFIGLAALTFAASGCSDELDYPHSTVEPGLPTTISVSVSLPEMTPITRADMVDGLDNEVNSLWIGIFDANSKEVVTSYFVPKENLKGRLSGTHTSNNITFDTKTGLSYIVAVANYENVICSTTSDDNKKGNSASLEKTLYTIKTLDEFENISTRFNDEGGIYVAQPLDALLMSGHFMESHDNNDYVKVEPKPVYIVQGKDGKNPTLDGAIHLRRLITQVKFNVSYNANNIEDFEVISWQVKNVPNQTWLFEDEGYKKDLNVGDNRFIGTSESYLSPMPSSQVISSTEKPTDKNKTYSFDWWQYENKRTGLSHVTNYNLREEEFKDGGLNTGKYKSLLKNSDSNDPNNNATYVELKVKMKVKNAIENGDKITERVVEAVYTIHLGYCDNNYDTETSSKARDFNCRRNTKYTYNVTVNNVNDIYLEATSNIENAPGAEGIISDVSVKYVELDAHYGVYNMYLTANDLIKSTGAGGTSGFRYMIICYDKDSTPVTIDSEKTYNGDRKYLDWIEISKTPNENDVLAAYNPNEVYTIDKFKEEIDNGNENLTAGYYTIFFNEYVYEDKAKNGNESGSTNWRGYVNKPPRQLWIRVLENKSSDGESVRYKSKYAFSQKSIQTYYGLDATTALGMERDNETFGLNMRNTFNNKNKGTKRKNGRYNTYDYVNNNKINGLIKWEKFMTQSSLQTVNAIDNQTLGVPYVPSKTVPLPKLTIVNGSQNDYDPDPSEHAEYIEAINACMNRNRDLNGNGEIDNYEIRWYVPTSNQYTEMILGSPSLDSPIMDYSSHPTVKEDINVNAGTNNDPLWRNINLNLFYYASNGEALWAMEGFSTSNWNSTDNDGVALYTLGYPWEVRCVRNLGTDLTQMPSNDSDQVQSAYISENNNTIRMKYYDEKSIRPVKNTWMRPHVISNQDLNSTYKAFQYSDKAIQLSSINTDTEIDKSEWAAWLNTENVCEKAVGAGWRVPNQKELMIMRKEGVVPYASNYNFYISATFAHYNEGIAFDGSIEKLDSDGFKVMMVRRPEDATVEQAAGCQENYGQNHYLRCVKDVE